MPQSSILDGQTLAQVYVQLPREQQAELESLAQQLLAEQEREADGMTHQTGRNGMTPNSRPVPPAHTGDGLTASAGRGAVDVSELRRIHASLERAHQRTESYLLRVELQQAMDRLGRQIEAATT